MENLHDDDWWKKKEKHATFSMDGVYRYDLLRRWGPGAAVNFIGLNPSTADATLDDPTIRRCIGFAKTWGFDALWMTNLFALRATDPKVMLAAEEPFGSMNDVAIKTAAIRSELVVAAWGVHGAHLDADVNARATLRHLHHLGLTKGGHPKHPLYLRAETKPVLWEAVREESL